MRNYSLLLLLIIFLMGCGPQTSSGETETAAVQETVTEQTENEMKLRHVVMFKFKAEATEADIQKVEAAFAGLADKIPEIKDFEWGTNNSPEGLSKDFTHCFLVTFDSEEGREIYLPHPDHKAFVEVLSPHLDDVMVIDYWAK